MSDTKHLLPQGPYFKTNLHTHSTISDGLLSPQQLKQLYKDLGYQVLAITDHNIIMDHSAMTDPEFLMLTGVEVNYNHQNFRPGFDGKTYHLNLIAKQPDNLWMPGSEMEIRYSPEDINAMIAKANEMGFLVIYNHPTWSCQSYPDYAPLKGLWGMEIRNSESCRIGNNENNLRIYKDLVTLGNKLYPVGADDTHKPTAAGLSWVMVGATELRYDSVIAALEKGAFYMSCGPEIYTLTINGSHLTITCSDAQLITLETHGRFARRVSAEGSSWIREAEFDLADFFARADDENMYVQLTVAAPNGNYAATRAYYLNELK